jgi:hypothetical protein
MALLGDHHPAQIVWPLADGCKKCYTGMMGGGSTFRRSVEADHEH